MQSSTLFAPASQLPRFRRRHVYLQSRPTFTYRARERQLRIAELTSPSYKEMAAMLHIFVFALLAQREGKPKRAARAEASDYGSMALAAKAATKEAEEVALSSGLPHGWSVIQVRSVCHGFTGCACRDPQDTASGGAYERDGGVLVGVRSLHQFFLLLDVLYPWHPPAGSHHRPDCVLECRHEGDGVFTTGCIGALAIGNYCFERHTVPISFQMAVDEGIPVAACCRGLSRSVLHALVCDQERFQCMLLLPWCCQPCQLEAAGDPAHEVRISLSRTVLWNGVL